MIQTAAIIWAAITTGGMAGASFGFLRLRSKFEIYQLDSQDTVHKLCSRWENEERKRVSEELRAMSLEDSLYAIKRTRHLAAKKARAAQLAQRAALVSAKAEQIRKEIGR